MAQDLLDVANWAAIEEERRRNRMSEHVRGHGLGKTDRHDPRTLIREHFRREKIFLRRTGLSSLIFLVQSLHAFLPSFFCFCFSFPA